MCQYTETKCYNPIKLQGLNDTKELRLTIASTRFGALKPGPTYVYFFIQAPHKLSEMLAGPCGRGEDMNQFSIKPLSIDDIPLLDLIKPNDWSCITKIHEHYLKTKAARCIKVVSEAAIIVGIGTGLSFNGTGWIAHIIVAKDYQNKGIGTLIVKDRIEDLKHNCGCKVITLTATDQGYPLYTKLGFSDETMYRILVKSNDNIHDMPQRKNVVPIRPKHYEAVLEIDKVTSGENRGDFLTPALQNGIVYINEGKILGFYLPGLGDGGISAINEIAGIELLKERTKEPNKIFVPEENNVAYNYLQSKGYNEVRKIHRMVLGNSFERKPENCYSRIGGFAG
jgi:GNAT superfamily N-acetyltransferase